MGIEPTSSAWEAEVLPLNYTRRDALFEEFTTAGSLESPPDDLHDDFPEKDMVCLRA